MSAREKAIEEMQVLLEEGQRAENAALATYEATKQDTAFVRRALGALVGDMLPEAEPEPEPEPEPANGGPRKRGHRWKPPASTLRRVVEALTGSMTTREVMQATGLSHTTAHRALAELAEEGFVFVARKDGQSNVYEALDPRLAVEWVGGE